MATDVVIAIGSNINPKENIERAIELLKENSKVLALAPHLTTAPIGITDQAAFVNTAVRISTNLSQHELKSWLKAIEDRLGRDRTRPKFGPREIDLDILAWDNTIVDDDYHTRPFLRELYNYLVAKRSNAG